MPILPFGGLLRPRRSTLRGIKSRTWGHLSRRFADPDREPVLFRVPVHCRVCRETRYMLVASGSPDVDLPCRKCGGATADLVLRGDDPEDVGFSFPN